jgi:hypothetical protein
MATPGSQFGFSSGWVMGCGMVIKQNQHGRSAPAVLDLSNPNKPPHFWQQGLKPP